MVHGLKKLPATAALLSAWLAVAPVQAAAAGDIVGVVNAPVAKHKANTVVYVKNAGLGVATSTVKMDQRGLVFTPRVLPIQKGTTVEFLNSDTVGHNVFTPDGDKYDLGTWPQGQTRKYTFSQVGVFRQLCKVHDDMIAFVVVVDSKHFTVSDKAGAFKIPALPPGKYTLGVWHEKLAAPDIDIEVEAGKPATVTIKLDRKS